MAVISTTLQSSASILSTTTTAVGNVGAGEDDLMSYSVPAGTLDTNGKVLSFEASGTFGASLNNKRIRVKFGASTIFDSGALAITALTEWVMRGSIIRTGATTQKCSIILNTTSASLSAYADVSTASETLANANILKLTGEAGANDDVLQETLVVRVG